MVVGVPVKRGPTSIGHMYWIDRAQQTENKSLTSKHQKLNVIQRVPPLLPYPLTSLFLPHPVGLVLALSFSQSAPLLLHLMLSLLSLSLLLGDTSHSLLFLVVVLTSLQLLVAALVLLLVDKAGIKVGLHAQFCLPTSGLADLLNRLRRHCDANTTRKT